MITAFALPSLAAALLLTGCGHNNQPVMMAPPATPVTISQPNMPPGQYQGQSADASQNGSSVQNGAYNWTEVPVNQQVQITRAVFDQGGYQLYSPQGTIVIPFTNQNMYVMKFGQSNTGGMYFVNNGQFPTLFIPPGASLGNAAQPGANWYPFPQNYAYSQPVYVGLAPSWSAFTGMGWYPGMNYYGGYWGASPYSIMGPMIGLHFLIGGSPYYGWNSYHSYYMGHPGYTSMRVVNRTVYNQAAHTSFNRGGFGSNSFGRRSFGSGGTTFGGRSTGSFGSGRPAFGSGFGGRRPALLRLLWPQPLRLRRLIRRRTAFLPHQQRRRLRRLSCFVCTQSSRLRRRFVWGWRLRRLTSFLWRRLVRKPSFLWRRVFRRRFVRRWSLFLRRGTAAVNLPRHKCRPSRNGKVSGK